MPTRFTTASHPTARRSSTPGAKTSASTTSTVGSRIRCLARSRRRDGTTTLTPRAASAATRWRPIKPEPPTTRTLMCFMRALFYLFAVVFVAGGFATAARRDHAQAGLDRHRLLLQQRGVEDRVRHDALHVLARLGVGNGFGVDRPFERAGVAPAARAVGAGVVRGRG